MHCPDCGEDPCVCEDSLNEKEKSPVGVSLSLAPKLSKKLNGYCSMTGVSKNSVISLAIFDFLYDRG